MQNQDHYRRKTRSHLIDDDKQVSRAQIPSNTNLDPCPQNSDIDSSKVKQQKQPSRKNNWNRKEKIKYFIFLFYYSNLPHWGSDLKSIPTYKTLSQFVKTRSPEQCKSFHLSNRRNYRSIGEQMKALKEEIQIEEGYQKMSDRYEMQIIAFEEKNGILKQFGLEEKQYFQNKTIQKCKQSGFNKNGLNISGESPQQPENDYNPKFNINDLIKEETNKQKFEKFPAIDNYQPLINMHYDSMHQTNPPQGQKLPNIMMSKSPYSAMSFYNQEELFSPIDRNKALEKSSMETIRQQGINPPLSYSAKNFSNHQNERFMQQNMTRMMQATKNAFPQYSTYAPYGSSPFGAMGQIHMAQFRNQLPYSLPPPGGISYIMQGYHEPYNLPSHYNDQNTKHKPNKSDTENLLPEKIGSNQNMIDPKEQTNFNEKRKEILLDCHQHWINWLRAVTELNKRKQMGGNLVMNSHSR